MMGISKELNESIYKQCFKKKKKKPTPNRKHTAWQPQEQVTHDRKMKNAKCVTLWTRIKK